MAIKQRELLRVIIKRFATFDCRNMVASNRTEGACVESEVVFNCINNRGVITLNKPKALNATNSAMIFRISEKLQEWESVIDMVIIKGTGRAFCAGGDVVEIVRNGPPKNQTGFQFIKLEYHLNNLIWTYEKPYIAIIDGITMGGGLGLSVHGKYRIATENTMCAMPETRIGSYPDVGATYFLSRLPGGLGMFLALTGHRLKGTDVVKTGIATHFCPSGSIPALLDGLLYKIDPCKIESEIKAYTKDISSEQFSLAPKKLLIDSIFTLPTIEDIFKALEKEGSDFSLQTLARLKQMSPVSLKLTIKGLQKGKQLTLQECLKMENRMSHAMISAKISSDFYEGVTALLIDKNKNPNWHPKLEDITDEMIESLFEPLEPDEELKL